MLRIKESGFSLALLWLCWAGSRPWLSGNKQKQTPGDLVATTTVKKTCWDLEIWLISTSLLRLSSFRVAMKTSSKLLNNLHIFWLILEGPKKRRRSNSLELPENLHLATMTSHQSTRNMANPQSTWSHHSQAFTKPYPWRLQSSTISDQERMEWSCWEREECKSE